VCEICPHQEEMNINLIIPATAVRKQIPDKDDFLYVPVTVQDKLAVLALVDSGAKVSVVDRDWLKYYFPSIEEHPQSNVKLQGFAGDSQPTSSVNLRIGCVNVETPIAHEFYVAISGYHMICGLDLMKKLHIGVTNIPLLHPRSSQTTSSIY